MTNRYKKAFLLTGDILCFIAAVSLTAFMEKQAFTYDDFLQNHIIFTLILSPLWATIFFIEGLYSLRTFNKNGLVVSLLRATTFSAITTVIFLYLFGKLVGVTPKTNLIIFAGLSLVFTYLWRRAFFNIFSYKVFTRDVCLIGTTNELTEIKEVINNKRHLGFNVVSEYDCFSKVNGTKAQLIVIQDKLLYSNEVGHGLFEALNRGVSILTLSEFSEIVLGKIPLSSIDHTWFIDSKVSINQGTYYYTKEILDKSLALTGLILCIPISIFLIPLLLITSGRTLIYSQKRVGLHNKEFTIFKFRSMRLDAEKNGVQWASVNDNRITPMGNFLRKTRLDEIPQLLNVLNGSMSFVGPRPERPEIIEERLQNVIPFYDYRHLVKPGVTGWAQVNYGYGASQEDSLEKLRFDLFYVKHKNFWLDLRIILKTIRVVLKKLGR